MGTDRGNDPEAPERIVVWCTGEGEPWSVSGHPADGVNRIEYVRADLGHMMLFALVLKYRRKLAEAGVRIRDLLAATRARTPPPASSSGTLDELDDDGRGFDA